MQSALIRVAILAVIKSVIHQNREGKKNILLCIPRNSPDNSWEGGLPTFTFTRADQKQAGALNVKLGRILNLKVAERLTGKHSAMIREAQ